MTQQLLEEVLHQQKEQAKDIKEQAKDLKDIKTTLQTIAVQDERINHCESQTSALWMKYDALMGADGVVPRVREHQAACPRKEVDILKKQLWAIVVGFGLACITLAFKVFSV